MEQLLFHIYSIYELACAGYISISLYVRHALAILFYFFHCNLSYVSIICSMKNVTKIIDNLIHKDVYDVRLRPNMTGRKNVY